MEWGHHTLDQLSCSSRKTKPGEPTGVSRRCSTHEPPMRSPMRHWLLTWTTYGTWLPGDDRGSITAIRVNTTGERVHYNLPGTPCVGELSELRDAARDLMKGPPIFLVLEQAKVLLNQFHETANYRSWSLDSVAIMANHIHIVVTVDGDPEPAMLLRDFKSYGSRSLTRRGAKPINGTWWTTGGSKRKLPDENARRAANEYVKNQARSLIIWTADENPGEPTV